MSLTNPKLFGLNVNSLLSDVRTKNTAIQNLGLSPLDIGIIRGSNNAGMSRFDWISFSRLNTPIYKSLDRLFNESGTFIGILQERAGTDQTLFGNLDLNGSLSGSAIRYRYRDYTQNNFRIADISTSRVSAWSSSDSRANNQNLDTQKKARISYGARVGIIQDGKLDFNTQSTDTVPLGNASSNTAPQTGIVGPAGQPRLQTTIAPELKEFPSEVPTSRIKCNINGNTVYLYAMKGIPLVFKGFFRNVNADVRISYDAAQTKASWKVVETGNSNLYSNFTNLGSTTSNLRYRSPISRERFIKLYYNPSRIVLITLNSANLRELPATALSRCTELNFAYNQIRTFPNFNFIAPNLETLQTMRNPFYLSDIESERNFNISVLNKIPQTVRTLNFEGSFRNSIERNIVSERLPELRSFNCGRGGGVSFHPDSRPTGSTQVRLSGGSPITVNPTTGSAVNEGSFCYCPDVPYHVTSYNIGSNDFRRVDLNAIPVGGTANDTNGNSITYTNGSFSFKKLTKLVSLNVSGCYHLDDSESGGVTTLDSANAENNTITSINYSVTALKIPTNLGGCTSLISYTSTYNRDHANQLLDGSNNYAFAACGSLESLNFYATNLGAINFPNFDNQNLKSLELRSTNIKGGAPGLADGSQTNVITATTFERLTSLETLYINSVNLLALPIHADAFLKNTSLTSIIYNSNGRSTGSISELFNTNINLTSINLSNNAFTGSPPNLANNGLVSYLNLTTNQLSGAIPAYSSTRLRYIYLQTNKLTTLNEPGSLTALEIFQAHNNLIAGEIPDFSGCGNSLRNLTLNNNKITGYKLGAFINLRRVSYIDLSANNLSASALNNILVDLQSNYDNSKRGRVTINLKNQTTVDPETGNTIQLTPSDVGFTAARFLISKGWSIGITGGIPEEPPII